jgi:hypothetical protein
VSVNFVASSRAKASSTVGAVSALVPLPSAARVGDELIAILGVDRQVFTQVAPAGWTQLAKVTGQPQGFGTGGLVVWRRRYAVGDDTTPTFGIEGTGVINLLLLAYRPVDATQPVDALVATGIDFALNFDMATQTTPGVTTSTRDCLLVSAFLLFENNATLTGPPGMTLRVDAHDDATPLYVFDEVIPEAGATGARTAVAANPNASGMSVSLALAPGADPLRDPVRVRLSEDASGLFVDAGIELAFFPNVDLDLGQPYVINDELGSGDLYRFTIAVDRLEGGLKAYTGETLMGRLDREYVREHVLQKGPEGGCTPTQALEVLLERLGVLYETPLPAFYLRTSTGLVEPKLVALTVAWGEDEEAPSVRSVLDEFFRPFTGYLFRASERDRLQVIAPWWASDPPGGPSVTLNSSDVLQDGVSVVEDAGTVTNRAVVSSQGYAFVEGQPLTPPAYLDVTPGAAFVDLGAPPAGRLDATSTLFIPFEEGALAEGSITVDCTLEVTEVRSLGGETTYSKPYSFTLDPGGSGAMDHTFNRGAFRSPMEITDYFYVYFTTVNGRPGIRVTSWVHQYPVDTFWGPAWVGYRILIDASGSKWTRSNEKTTGSWGELTQHQGASPGLSESLGFYGVREERVDTGVYQLDASTCLAMARSIVENNLNPDLLYTVRLAPPWRVRPSHVGRLVQLPDGRRGTVEAWEYQEGHSPASSQASVTARVRVENRLTATTESDDAYGTAAYGPSVLRPAATAQSITVGPQPAAPLPLSNYQWFVDPAAAPGGSGSLASPFRTIDEMYAAAAAGNKILLRAGVHRRSSALAIGKVLEIHGEDGTIWSGSEDWSTPKRTGGDAWVQVAGNLYRTPYQWFTAPTMDASRETTSGDGFARYQRADNAQYPSPVADPLASNNRANKPHAVFLNGLPLYQEMSQAACDGTPTRSAESQERWLGLQYAGTFYVDETNHYLYVNIGRALGPLDLIEVTASHKWVTPAVTGAVVLRNLHFKHAWARIQQACLKLGEGWTLQDCTLEWGLGRLLDVANNCLVDGNALKYAGQLGIGGSASGWVVKRSQVLYANTEECHIGFEAGGTKFAFCQNALTEDLEVAYCFGEGQWWDIDNGDTGACTIRRPVSHHNARSGVFWEISGQPGVGNLIDSPRCWENGHWAEYIGAAAGITITSSNGVEVRDGVLAWNANQIVVRADDRATNGSYNALNDINVHDNLMVGFDAPGETLPNGVTQYGGKGYLLAWITDGGYEARLFGAGRNNRGSANRYHHTGTYRWAWEGSKGSIDAFNNTPGEEGGQVVSAAAASEALLVAGVPLAPQNP